MVALVSASANASLVVERARWLLCPIPKVASTLLKRLAVLPTVRAHEGAAIGETRPALAIHRPQIHGLPALAQLHRLSRSSGETIPMPCVWQSPGIQASGCCRFGTTNSTWPIRPTHH